MDYKKWAALLIYIAIEVALLMLMYAKKWLPAEVMLMVSQAIMLPAGQMVKEILDEYRDRTRAVAGVRQQKPEKKCKRPQSGRSSAPASFDLERGRQVRRRRH
jgi:hypothetical protein